MSTARKILSNTIWQISGKAIVSLLGIVTVKIITNYLSTSEYGNYTIIYEYIAFFGIAADFGLFTIAVREMSRDERLIPKVVGNVLSLRTLLSVVVLSIASLVAFFIPKYQGTPVPIGVIFGAITTALILINGAIVSVLQAHLKMQAATITLVIGKILIVGYLFLTIFFLFPNNPTSGFYHLLIAGVIGNGVMLVLSYLLTRPYVEIRFRFDFDFWRQVLFKAMPYGLALILSTIYFRVDSILLYFMRSSHEVGIYGVSMRIMEMMTILPLYFMNSVLPVLTRKLAEKSKRVKEIIQYSFDFLFMLGMPIVVGGFLLAFSIIFVVTNPQFLSGWHCTENLSVVFMTEDAARVGCETAAKGFTLTEPFFQNLGAYFYQYGSDVAFQIILFAMFFSFLNTLFVFILIALGRQVKILWINLAGVILNIIGNIIVIPYYGFVGAAITTVVTEFFILVASFLYVRKFLPYDLSFSRAARVMLASFLMGVFVYLLRDPLFGVMQNKNILILIPLGAALYGAVLWFTKAITPELLSMFLKKD